MRSVINSFFVTVHVLENQCCKLKKISLLPLLGWNLCLLIFDQMSSQYQLCSWPFIVGEVVALDHKFGLVLASSVQANLLIFWFKQCQSYKFMLCLGTKPRI